jgi:anti-sigma factor RsiW
MRSRLSSYRQRFPEGRGVITVKPDGSHPDRTSLEAYALGRLESTRIDHIEAHMADCPACARIVKAVPDDRLIELLHRRSPGMSS